MNDLRNKTIMVTGSTSGMGKYIVVELARRGATLLLHGRDDTKLAKVSSDIRTKTGNERLRIYTANFLSLKQVQEMASKILSQEPRLDVLINNAGIGFGTPLSKREVSEDRYESRFAVNYLAPFLLTRRLLPLLKKSAPARIVNVASAGQQPIDFSDVMLERHFSKTQAYMQSKLAMVMMTFDMAADLDGTGVTVNVLHPATFMNTKMVREALIPPINSVRAGAEPTIRLAVASEVEGVTGEYFDGTRRARANPQAYDKEARRRLRVLSEQLTNPTGTK
jgi:NAD(P)-dependent dehydrogenase (short-subunit alcohol dehydrogenase family)